MESIDCKPVTEAPASPDQLSKRIDMHVHMVGTAWRVRRLAAVERMASLAGRLSCCASSVSGERAQKAISKPSMRSIFCKLVRESSMDAVVLLAHERVHDPDGTPREDLGSMFVPNDVVLGLAKHPGISAGRFDSSGPARCARRTGALPRRRRRPDEMSAELPEHRFFRYGVTGGFGSEWRKRGLPLLAHTGGEHTVPVINAALADPRLLRFPLECGVTVIAAHCGTRAALSIPIISMPGWGCCANSRIFTATSARWFRSIAAAICAIVCATEIAPRILHGSDFPVPVLGHRMWLQGWIDRATFRRCQKIANPLERDWQFKLALGFSERRSRRELRRIAAADNGSRMIFTNARLIFLTEFTTDSKWSWRGKDRRDSRATISRRTIDLGGNYLAPGFIDLHIRCARPRHDGGVAGSVSRAICDYHATGGTTSLLLTTVTAPIENCRRCLRAVRDFGGTPSRKSSVCMSKGLSFRGRGAGAQREEFIRDPDRESVDQSARNSRT